jgi:glycosyltransferase involved in cell wall biosynthesis
MQVVNASVLLLTYNQELFVQDALQSLLDQNYDPLEIVVSDDCSSDSTWEIVSKISKEYIGHKTILLNRNSTNLGIVGNYFKAFRLSKGDVIFTAAGDDISLSSRCSECINAWQQHNQKIDLIATDAFDMALSGEVVGQKKTDELGSWSFEKWVKTRPYMFGASHMMTRRLLALADLSTELQVEDQNLIARALMMGGALRIPVPLVKHRRGGISQLKRRYTYEQKKAKLLASARNSLLECQEISRDAKLLSQQVEVYLGGQVNLALYMIEILEAVTFIEKCQIFFAYPSVSLNKRLRFFQFTVFVMLNKNLMVFKSFLRGHV